MVEIHANRFLATFAPGFEGIIESLLIRSIPSATGIQISSGLILFDFTGSIESVISLAFFNNIFLIVQQWDVNTHSFEDMVKASTSTKKKSRLADFFSSVPGQSGNSFRVRYSKENQFCSVDKKVMLSAEQYITSQTRLMPDRLNPDFEFWYIIRREKYSFFTFCLTKKQSTDKYLAQGELRPEIVQLIVALARVTAQDKIILDPFAGYGSIPEHLSSVQGDALVYASDLDTERITDLEKRFSGKKRISVRGCDATHLDYIADGSVDLVVTDPPWGFWESDGYVQEKSIDILYAKLLSELQRILNSRGRAVILTGAKKEFALAVANSAVFEHCALDAGFKTDILVNGKKSAVFVLHR